MKRSSRVQNTLDCSLCSAVLTELWLVTDRQTQGHCQHSASKASRDKKPVTRQICTTFSCTVTLGLYAGHGAHSRKSAAASSLLWVQVGADRRTDGRSSMLCGQCQQVWLTDKLNYITYRVIEIKVQHCQPYLGLSPNTTGHSLETLLWFKEKYSIISKFDLGKSSRSLKQSRKSLRRSGSTEKQWA